MYEASAAYETISQSRSKKRCSPYCGLPAARFRISTKRVPAENAVSFVSYIPNWTKLPVRTLRSVDVNIGIRGVLFIRRVVWYFARTMRMGFEVYGDICTFLLQMDTKGEVLPSKVTVGSSN